VVLNTKASIQTSECASQPSECCGKLVSGKEGRGERSGAKRYGAGCLVCYGNPGMGKTHIRLGISGAEVWSRMSCFAMAIRVWGRHLLA